MPTPSLPRRVLRVRTTPELPQLSLGRSPIGGGRRKRRTPQRRRPAPPRHGRSGLLGRTLGPRAFVTVRPREALRPLSDTGRCQCTFGGASRIPDAQSHRGCCTSAQAAASGSRIAAAVARASAAARSASVRRSSASQQRVSSSRQYASPASGYEGQPLPPALPRSSSTAGSGRPVSSCTLANLTAAQAVTKPSSRSLVSSTASSAVPCAVSRSPTASATTDRLKRLPARAGGVPSRRPASIAPSRSSAASTSLPRTYQTRGRIR